MSLSGMYLPSISYKILNKPSKFEPQSLIRKAGVIIFSGVVRRIVFDI